MCVCVCVCVCDAGSSEYESASQRSSSSGPEENSLHTALEGQATLGRMAPESTGQDRDASHSAVPSPDPSISPPGQITTQQSRKQDSRPERCNSVAGSELRPPRRPPADGYSLSYPRSHRREPSDPGEGGSPSRIHHRRIHSLSISGYSSRSTSAYSTLSERSERAAAAAEDTESLLSLRTRVTTQSRVEQSRVDTSSVIDELLQANDISRSADEEALGLQIYVDQSKGDCVVAGPNLDR